MPLGILVRALILISTLFCVSGCKSDAFPSDEYLEKMFDDNREILEKIVDEIYSSGLYRKLPR